MPRDTPVLLQLKTPHTPNECWNRRFSFTARPPCDRQCRRFPCGRHPKGSGRSPPCPRAHTCALRRSRAEPVQKREIMPRRNTLSQQARCETRGNEANACRSYHVSDVATTRQHEHGKTPKHKTLYLDKVGWQASAAVGVEVGERRSHCGGSDPACHAEGDYTPPGRLALHDLSCEEGVDKKIVEVGVLDVCVLDVVKERSPDDAATLPDTRTLSEVHAPLEVLGCALDEVHAL